MSLRQWVKRYWRSKGFGIHSPFAYMFVTEIVHCPYLYYAYDDIADGYRDRFDKNLFNDSKLLHRIVARFDITKAVVPSDAESMLLNAIKRANSRTKIVDKVEYQSNQVIYLSSDKTNLKCDIDRLMEQDMIFVLFRGIDKDAVFRQMYEQMSRCLKNGVVLEDLNKAIIVVNKKMPKMHYDVRL